MYIYIYIYDDIFWIGMKIMSSIFCNLKNGTNIENSIILKKKLLVDLHVAMDYDVFCKFYYVIVADL